MAVSVQKLYRIAFTHGRTGCFQSYLQMVLTELKEYAEVSACQRITENNRIITDFQKGTKSSLDGLLEKILQPANLNNAYRKVKSNKGAGGVDGMSGLLASIIM